MHNLRRGLGVILVLMTLGLAVVTKRHSLHQRLEPATPAPGIIETGSTAMQQKPDLEQQTQETRRLHDQNAALSNLVKRLKADLARSLPSQTQTSLQRTLPPSSAAPDPDVEVMVNALLQGDGRSLDTLATMTREAVRGDHPNMTLAEQAASAERMQPLRAVFDSLTDRANQGDSQALQALAQAARRPELSGLAIQSLGHLAGNGSEGALNVILDPAKYGLDVPLASTVGALQPAAERGNPRAIEALATVAADDHQQPLWFMAADGLGKAAALGNPRAIEGLIALARSTNANVIRAVRVGLGAAAQHNEAARSALERLNPVPAATQP